MHVVFVINIKAICANSLAEIHGNSCIYILYVHSNYWAIRISSLAPDEPYIFGELQCLASLENEIFGALSQFTGHRR